MDSTIPSDSCNLNESMILFYDSISELWHLRWLQGLQTHPRPPHQAGTMCVVSERARLALPLGPWGWGLHTVIWVLSCSWVARTTPVSLGRCEVRIPTTDLPLRGRGGCAHSLQLPHGHREARPPREGLLATRRWIFPCRATQAPGHIPAELVIRWGHVVPGSEVLPGERCSLFSYFFPATSKRKLFGGGKISGGNSQTVTLSDRSSAALARKELVSFQKLSWCSGTQLGDQDGIALTRVRVLVLVLGADPEPGGSSWRFHKLRAGFSSRPRSPLLSPNRAVNSARRAHRPKCCSFVCAPWRALLHQHSVVSLLERDRWIFAYTTILSQPKEFLLPAKFICGHQSEYLLTGFQLASSQKEMIPRKRVRDRQCVPESLSILLGSGHVPFSVFRKCHLGELLQDPGT